MKANTHPDYHDIKVIHTDGSEHTYRSCYGKPGDVIRLDIDHLNHPAWTGGSAKILEKGRLAKFGNKYAGLGVAAADKANKKEKEEVKKEEPKA